jgi:hypothetical protein
VLGGKMGFDIEKIKNLLLIISIIIFLVIIFFIVNSILKHPKQKESKTEKSESHLLRNILFITVIILGCISIIPYPFVFIASAVTVGDYISTALKVLCLLSFFYPAYIALPFFYGRDLIVNKNKKIGYAFVILSGLLSIGLIIFFISIKLK